MTKKIQYLKFPRALFWETKLKPSRLSWPGPLCPAHRRLLLDSRQQGSRGLRPTAPEQDTPLLLGYAVSVTTTCLAPALLPKMGKGRGGPSQGTKPPSRFFNTIFSLQLPKGRHLSEGPSSGTLAPPGCGFLWSHSLSGSALGSPGLAAFGSIAELLPTH